MSPPRIERSLRAVRWLVPAAAIALAPKCLLCIVAYAGLGSALGLGSAELCGAPAASSHAWLILLGVSLLCSAGWLAFVRARSHDAAADGD